MWKYLCLVPKYEVCNYKTQILGEKMKTKEEIRKFAEEDFKKDLRKTYEQLGVNGYDEIFQENRNIPNNKDERIYLITLDNENMKHAMKRMLAFSAKMGLENQKIQRGIKWLTWIIVIFMLFQLVFLVTQIYILIKVG